MKLLAQGDDYGLSRSVTYGIDDSIAYGMVRNTGIFINMPARRLAIDLMSGHPNICYGIDFNIVCGHPVLDPGRIPHLVTEDGSFLRSGAAVSDPRYGTADGRREMFPYDEVYAELRAQFDRYVAEVGKAPGYLHAHSLQHENYEDAIRQISRETGIPYSMDLFVEQGFLRSWLMHPPAESAQKKQFDAAAQLGKDTLHIVRDDAEEFLAHDKVALVCHPGYVDAELLECTSLSLERLRDAQMFQSAWLADWVRANDVELVTYYDLY